MYTLYKYIYTPPLRGGGGVKTEIFQKGVGPPPHLEIFQLKKWFHHIYIYILLFIHIYRYVYLSTCMYIYMYMYAYVCICMYVQNERVCHTISGLQCGIRRTPSHVFWKPKKHVGVVYFMWSGEIFLRNFLPYPPPNIPGLKGGIYIYTYTIIDQMQLTIYIYIYIHIYIDTRSSIKCWLKHV